MRDIPVFTTDHGVASLILKEIAYKKEAYIKIQNTCEPQPFLDECIGFCRAAGADQVYATGHEALTRYPLHTELWRMCCQRQQLPVTGAALFPVQEKTLEHWRQIYNDRMCRVPNAATMTLADAQALLKEGSAYFVHSNGILLGIGKAAGETLDAVASVVAGAGQDVVAALCSALSSERVSVEVASANVPAVRLYERLGFVRTAKLSSWYQVYPRVV